MQTYTMSTLVSTITKGAGYLSAIKKSANKTLHSDPKSYATFVALSYNATKAA